MGHDFVPVFALFSVFVCIAFAPYVFYSTRNRERMALIERGQDASIFFSSPAGISMTLRIGLLAMGIGVGILLAEMLVTAGLREEVSFPALIFLMGGFGLLIAYWLDGKNKENLKNAREKRDARVHQEAQI